MSGTAQADASKSNADKKTADQKVAADAAHQKQLRELKAASQASDEAAATEQKAAAKAAQPRQIEGRGREGCRDRQWRQGCRRQGRTRLPAMPRLRPKGCEDSIPNKSRPTR